MIVKISVAVSSDLFTVSDTILFLDWGKHGKNYSKYVGKMKNLVSNNSPKIWVLKYLWIKTKFSSLGKNFSDQIWRKYTLARKATIKVLTFLYSYL